MAKTVKVYIAQVSVGIGGAVYVPGERIQADAIPAGLVKSLVEDGAIVAEKADQTELAEDAGLGSAATTQVLQRGLNELAAASEVDAPAPAEVAATVPIVDQPVKPAVEAEQTDQP